jgi:hypothetical protein
MWPAGRRGFRRLPRDAFCYEEVHLRALFLAAVFSTAIGAVALADESVSGDWRADVGSGVVINMNVKADGGWSSETLQSNKVVRQMKGTYKQTPSADNAGTLVFTPTQAKVQRGKVQTEVDKYELAEGGKQLKLTSGGDTMVFEKR